MSVLFDADAYKLSHKGFMEEGTEYIYSNMTPRNTKYMPVNQYDYDKKVVWSGLQGVAMEYLIEAWNREFFNQPKAEVIGEFKEIIDAYLGEGAISMKHFEDLHDLGYLPIEIKALPEGSRVNEKVPFFTIVNTNPKFAWLTNYLETVLSAELWKASTVATIAYEYRKLVNAYAMETTGSLVGTEFQIHGFEFRGMSGRMDAARCAASFLTSTCGTDTASALPYLKKYYGVDYKKDFVAASVPASEHSITSLGIAVHGEMETLEKWMTKDYPTGIVSLVSDTLDYWKVITEYLPQLKDTIMSRKENSLGLSKVVIRPDSGDPVEIICGADFKQVGPWFKGSTLEEWKEAVAEEMDEMFRDNLDAEDPHCSETYLWQFGDSFYEVTYEPELNRHDRQYYYVDNYGSTLSKCTFTEIQPTPEQKGSIQCLWETFGGTVNEKGYKVLESHIGLIYGDSITLARAKEIFQRLEAKGFASTNVVFGVGSYSLQYITRDSAGMAIKATWAQVDGEGYDLFKDPKTDSGTKKSARGLLRVEKEGDDFVLYDKQTPEQETTGALEPIFRDGKLLKFTTLNEIRERLWG